MPAGLIQDELDVDLTKAQTTPGAPPAGSIMSAPVTGVDPALRQVDEAKETVSGQLDRLLAADSPYLQRAQAGAAQTANARGLLNSTMAAQAGQAAAIDAAAPIAGADASIYGTASRENTAATNASRALNAEAANRSSLQSSEAYNRAGLQTLQGEQQMALQTLRGSQAETLANIEANYKTLIQASASASSFYTSTMNNMAAVMADPKTTAEQKQAAVDKLNVILQSGLAIMGATANIDLVSLLDFSGGPNSLNQNIWTAPPVEPAPPPAPNWNTWYQQTDGGGGGTAAGGGEGANAGDGGE